MCLRFIRVVGMWLSVLLMRVVLFPHQMMDICIVSSVWQCEQNHYEYLHTVLSGHVRFHLLDK